MMGFGQPFINNHYNVSTIERNPARRTLQDRIRQLQILDPEISQQKLADRLGVPRRTLRRWLSGETKTTTPERERKLSKVVTYERRKVTKKVPITKDLPVVPRLVSIFQGIPYIDPSGLTNEEILKLAAAAGDQNQTVQFQIELEQPYFDRKGRGTTIIRTKPLEITSDDIETDEDMERLINQIFANANRETDSIYGLRIEPI